MRMIGSMGTTAYTTTVCTGVQVPVRKGITFDDVRMACETFTMRNFVRLADKSNVPTTSHANGGSVVAPAVGAVILWHPKGSYG